MTTSEAIREARTILREQDGSLRTCQALELGIHPRTLYGMRDGGILDRHDGVMVADSVGLGKT